MAIGLSEHGQAASHNLLPAIRPTRHGGTTHNARKQNVRCNLCTEDKALSRAMRSSGIIALYTLGLTHTYLSKALQVPR